MKMGEVNLEGIFKLYLNYLIIISNSFKFNGFRRSKVLGGILGMSK
jgi:hypothetical protein